jgi:hypothetical protein
MLYGCLLTILPVSLYTLAKAATMLQSTLLVSISDRPLSSPIRTLWIFSADEKRVLFTILQSKKNTGAKVGEIPTP